MILSYTKVSFTPNDTFDTKTLIVSLLGRSQKNDLESSLVQMMCMCAANKKGGIYIFQHK